jgi:hypothetical protein
MGQVPKAWRMRFNQIVGEIELTYQDFEQATEAAALFINPILDGRVTMGVWNPEVWEWKTR